MGKHEGKIEKYLIDQGNEKGFLVYKFRSPGNNGVPDRILIGHGYVFFVETKKSENEEPRTLQKRIINKMIDHGAYAYVIGCKSDVDTLLASFIENNPKKPEKIK